MKTLNRLNKNWLFVIIAFMAIVMISCEDNDGGIPVIHYIRVTDPALADSTFTDVSPGQMIAIIGENFSNLLKVYINEQEVSFNANYSTSTSIVLTVPSDLLLTGSTPGLSGEIRVVTGGGEAVYSMHVLSPAPTIGRLVVNYPATPGESMRIIGSNFVEIQRIYFTTEDPYREGGYQAALATEINVTNYTVNNDFTEITLSIPQGIFDSGYLVIQCYTNMAVSEFYRNLPMPVVSKISSDMPIIGSEVYITGNSFIGVTSINVNDDFTIFAEDLTIAESADTIRFIMPKAPSKSGKISVVALGGIAEIEETFYPLENVILDYDTKGWYSWGGETVNMVGNGVDVPYVTTGTCYGITGKPGAWQYWWGNAINGTVFPGADIIPTNTPIANLEIRFECYVSYPLDDVTFQYVLCADWDHPYDDFVPTDRMTGSTTLGRWFTCSRPLSNLTPVSTFQGLLDKANTELGLYTKNKSANGDTVVEMFFDNFRIVKVN